MYCDSDKQINLMRIIIEFYRMGREVIESGAPLSRVTSLGCVQDIIRAKSVIPNGDKKTFEKLSALARQQMTALGGKAT